MFFPMSLAPRWRPFPVHHRLPSDCAAYLAPKYREVCGFEYLRRFQESTAPPITPGVLVSCGSGCFNFTGGSLDVWNASNQLLFHGTFSGSVTNVNGVITVMANQGGNPVVA